MATREPVSSRILVAAIIVATLLAGVIVDLVIKRVLVRLTAKTATDLDDETLIKYIDRFLMFYIRTGERLQRTSVWMDNLEGGIDYLREVVIEDSLGIAAELEQQMALIR